MEGDELMWVLKIACEVDFLSSVQKVHFFILCICASTGTQSRPAGGGRRPQWPYHHLLDGTHEICFSTFPYFCISVFLYSPIVPCCGLPVVLVGVGAVE